VNPDAPWVGVAVGDVGKAAAALLLESDAVEKNGGKTYSITSPVAYSSKELVAAFSKSLHKEIQLVTVPYEAAKASFVGAGWPEWQVEGLLELFKFTDDAVFKVSPPNLSTPLPLLLSPFLLFPLAMSSHMLYASPFTLFLTFRPPATSAR
jgi:uncharacterized protein YbjT (DUF2867 family)